MSMLPGRLPTALLAPAVAVLAWAAGAAGAQTVQEFPLPAGMSSPTLIVSQPSGPVLFTALNGSLTEFATIDSSGTVKILASVSGGAAALAIGSDNAPWFTQPGDFTAIPPVAASVNRLNADGSVASPCRSPHSAASRRISSPMG